MSKFISLFFTSLYLITLITCFIVNLAVSHSLTWFFIVFAALLIPFTLTSLFYYVKKHKVLIISLSFISSIMILLGVINIYTSGTWFFVASSPIVFAYLVVFIPILIGLYELPETIKRHRAIICFTIDLIGLLVMLMIINMYDQGDWLLQIAYPIALFSSSLPLLFIIIIRYLKINRYFKVSLSLFVGAIFTVTINYFIAWILDSEVNQRINLIIWSNEEYISGNVNVINFLTLMFISLLFTLMGIFKKLTQTEDK